jgi:hypothetical protein
MDGAKLVMDICYGWSIWHIGNELFQLYGPGSSKSVDKVIQKCNWTCWIISVNFCWLGEAVFLVETSNLAQYRPWNGWISDIDTIFSAKNHILACGSTTWTRGNPLVALLTRQVNVIGLDMVNWSQLRSTVQFVDPLANLRGWIPVPGHQFTRSWYVLTLLPPQKVDQRKLRQYKKVRLHFGK